MESKKIQIILVGGIGGEILSLPFIGRYMSCLKPILQKLLPGSHIFTYQPSIFQKMDISARNLSQFVRDAFYFHQQKTLIVGHSRGALEALKTAIDHPDLLEKEMLQGLILLSPPLKGSPIADTLSRFFSWPALRQLSMQNLKPQWSSMWKMQDAGLQIKLQSLTCLVQTYVEKKDTVCWALKFSRWLMDRKNQVSDGLVPLDHQVLPWTPQQEIKLNNHHGYISCESTLSNCSSDEKRDLFSRCLQGFASSDGPAHNDASHVIERLDVATYNVGALKIPIWGIPFPRTRWKAIRDSLKSRNLDFVFLQEVFTDELRRQIPSQFPEYQVLLSPNKPHNGLVVLFKKSKFQDCKEFDFYYKRFQAQRKIENLFGFEKGFIFCKVQLKNVTHPLYLINLHLTAFSEAKLIRRRQRYEIIELIKELKAQNKNGHFVMAGDFNEPLRHSQYSTQPTFSIESALHQLKNPLNRNEKSQNIDFILFHSDFLNEQVTASTMNLDMQHEKIEVQTKKGNLEIELSDHWMVRTELQLTRNPL